MPAASGSPESPESPDSSESLEAPEVPEAPDAEIVISFPTLDNEMFEPAVILTVLKSLTPEVEATNVVPVPAF